MKKVNMILSLLLSSILTLCSAWNLNASAGNPNSTSTIKTFQGDFEQALKHASANGKLLLVDFYADWCMPCKWMDKTTFSDPNVANELNEHYVVYKANIDQPVGSNEVERFEVKVIPTILIFNTKGEIQERIEETMSPDQLLPILDFHNHPNNTLKITHSINQSPETKSSEELISNHDLQVLYEEYKRKEQVKSSYRLQIGVFEDYKDAFQKVNELRDTFLEEIIVLNETLNGKPVYKVMMGQFNSQNEADSFRQILLNHYNIDTIIR